MYLNDKKIEWVNQIKLLGNYVDRDLNDSIDCTHKKSIFIGQVNNLCANFGCLQMSVLVQLTVVHFMDLKCGTWDPICPFCVQHMELISNHIVKVARTVEQLDSQSIIVLLNSYGLYYEL